jgi:phosphodiesterase/alkaline phosphatase D-like protein
VLWWCRSADYADQDEMMGFLESNRISNFVVLTGDIHVRHASASSSD